VGLLRGGGLLGGLLPALPAHRGPLVAGLPVVPAHRGLVTRTLRGPLVARDLGTSLRSLREVGSGVADLVQAAGASLNRVAPGGLFRSRRRRTTG
jgi:hypothetical protein